MTKNLLAYPLILIGLIFLFSLEGSSAILAQEEDAFVRQVRAFDAGNIGLLNPIGLAFSPGANNFLILEADKSAQPASSVSDIIKISPVEERVGSVAIIVDISDPINMAFDGKANRLLLFDSETKELIEIKTGSNGTLDPTALTRHDVRHFGLQNPQSLTIDPGSGHLFFLDGVGPRLVHVEPDPDQGFDKAVISVVDLQPTGLVDLRGLAFDPGTGHLHLFSRAKQALIELTQTGQPVAIRDITGLELDNPQGMVFAPSGDLTDDPLRMNLYLADQGTGAGDDEGDEGQQNPGQIIELSLVEPIQKDHMTAVFTSNLVQVIDAWQWSPPSPDSIGITYLPASDTLLVSDSEVDEMAIFTGINLFESTLTGNLINTFTTISFSDEPTGVTVDLTNGHLFFSDDTGSRSVYEMNPGPDRLYDTPDDIITSFVTSEFGSTDPEGITYACGLKVLFIADMMNNEVYKVAPGANGIFDGVDDQVAHFDTVSFGLNGPQGIAFNGGNGNLYIVGIPTNTLFEVSTGGALVRMIDISETEARRPAGLAYAPSSIDPTVMNIYIADRGVDNDSDPNENDGRVYEMTLPATTNLLPVANDDSAKTLEDVRVTIDVTDNDTDPECYLDPASANTTCDTCADPIDGTLINNGNGTFDYTPNPGFSGGDSFAYEICDTSGLCAQATVSIVVLEITDSLFLPLILR